MRQREAITGLPVTGRAMPARNRRTDARLAARDKADRHHTASNLVGAQRRRQDRRAARFISEAAYNRLTGKTTA
jgi:hypothetical protein